MAHKQRAQGVMPQAREHATGIAPVMGDVFFTQANLTDAGAGAEIDHDFAATVEQGVVQFVLIGIEGYQADTGFLGTFAQCRRDEALTGIKMAFGKPPFVVAASA